MDWYNEIKYYKFSKSQFSMETGHFTQLIWKATKNLGVGIAFTSSKRKVYVVAQYSPPGNMEEAFKENVLPGKC
jgi:glioma pathogenesis-related protein 2